MMKDWEKQEEIVKWIEQSILPNSRVERDVDMPILTSQGGSTRQCDVVIWQGEEPRETITIIEVQKRKRKIEIGDFSNWITKMEQVGAQHLICVSEKGFPESVIEQVFQKGPSVRLVKFSQIHDKEFFNFSGVLELSTRKIHNFESSLLALDTDEFPTAQTGKIDREAMVVFNKVEMKFDDFLIELAQFYERERKIDCSGDYIIDIELAFENDEIMIPIDKVLYKLLQLRGKLTYSLLKTSHVMEIYNYHQIHHEGTLAWLYKAIVEIEGTELSYHIVFTPQSDGDYHVSQFILEKENNKL